MISSIQGRWTYCMNIDKVEITFRVQMFRSNLEKNVSFKCEVDSTQRNITLYL